MLTDRAAAQKNDDNFAAGAASAAESPLSRLAKSPVAFAVILLVGLVAWLPGILSLPPLDRDESRFAEASRQMVESRNYIDIRFAAGARYNKPVGIYWLQSAAARIAGDDRISSYRLPSLLGGILSMLFLFVSARRFVTPQTALLASLLLGTSVLLTGESVIATTDAALLASIIAAQFALMRVYVAGRTGETVPLAPVLAGWVAIGAGILLKGPVIVGVAGVTVLALSLWDRDAKWLRASRPFVGAAAIITIVAPWAIAIGFASHGAFYQQSLGHDFAAKLMGPEESHGAPPGYYLALASFTFWPAIILLLPALALATSQRSDPVYRYLLAWSGAVWLLFECVPTKLPHYILPVYPALALLCAVGAAQPRSIDLRGWRRVLRHVAMVQFALGAIALAGLCLYLPARFGGSPGWPLFFGIILGLAAAGVAITLLLRQDDRGSAISAMASALAFYFLLSVGVAPRLEKLWLSPRAAELAEAHRRPGDPPVMLTGYVEPSLMFMLGSDTRIESGYAAGRAAAAKGGLVLADDHSSPQILSGVTDSGATARPLGEVTGLDYSTGHNERVTLYRVTPKQ